MEHPCKAPTNKQRGAEIKAGSPRQRLRQRLPTCKPARCERETAFVLAFPESFPALPPACGAADAREPGRDGEDRITKAARPSPTAARPGGQRALAAARRGLPAAARPRPLPHRPPPRAPAAAAARPRAGSQRRRARHPTVASRPELRAHKTPPSACPDPVSTRSSLAVASPQAPGTAAPPARSPWLAAARRPLSRYHLGP